MIISNVLLFTVEFLKTYIASAGIFKIKQKRKVFFFYLAAGNRGRADQSGGCAVAYNTDCFSEKYESVCALCHFDSLHVMPECGRI